MPECLLLCLMRLIGAFMMMVVVTPFVLMPVFSMFMRVHMGVFTAEFIKMDMFMPMVIERFCIFLIF